MAFDPTARPPLRKALAALGNPEYRWPREALGVLEFAKADGNPGGVLQVIDRLQKGVALLATLAERGHEPREYVFSWRACRHHTNEECPGCSCPIAGSTGCSTPTCAANTRRRRDDRDRHRDQPPDLPQPFTRQEGPIVTEAALAPMPIT